MSSKLRDLRLDRTGRIIAEDCGETLAHDDFPSAYLSNLQVNNPLEWLIREIRRRMRAVRSFSNGHVALMLVDARPRYMASQK